MTVKPASNISYFEYKVINELMHSHVEEFGDNLRAVIAFGPLVAGEETFDIELLEIIDQWSGPSLLPFGSTESLPTRGKLLLHFLSTSEFEDLFQRDTHGLTEALQGGYKVIYEVPAGYVGHVLKRTLETNVNLAINAGFSDPRRPLAQ